MKGRPPWGRGQSWVPSWLLVALLSSGSSSAIAAPGQAIRLGGAEAQGPASRAVTALHHNPAMLGALAGTRAHVAVGSGIDQQWIRRYSIDRSTGAPVDGLQGRVSLVNPMIEAFVGASFYFDPIAIGLGIYNLSSRFRFYSADPLRYHLAPDPDLGPDASSAARLSGGCLALQIGACPPDGGLVDYRQDFTFALAWNAGDFQLGVAIHFPRLRTRFAFDDDTSLAPADGETRCQAKEDPDCAERMGFKGFSRWLPGATGPGGFDLALTFGISWQALNDRVTLGARYRTFPLRRGGQMIASGTALVCRPEGEGPSGDGVPPCGEGSTIDATLTERIPQEVAIGGAFVLGRSKLWRIDTNLYWIDYCAGGLHPAQCDDHGGQTLRLIGLERDSFVFPEFHRYRGLQDLYGVDAYATYRIRSNLSLSGAAHFASPSVRPDAATAAHNDGWRLGTTFAAAVRVRNSDFLLIPGYGIDVWLPNDVEPSSALFAPTLYTDFEDAGGDLNSAGGQAVLAGRARPTNAGRYTAMAHTFTLGFRWAERSLALDQ